ncbi:MAG: HEAT repeat domain-containing protein, partial [Anaerolineae bacterium]|nr:HEAT repeat domain-containing protein [Anaerolineae bacterium]
MTSLDDLRHPDPEQRRQAIIAAARQGSQEALPALDQLTRLDPDTTLRELARKAIRHIHKIQGSPDPLGFDEAHRQFILALQTYKKRGAVAAAPVLAKALRLDPTLEEDELTRRIAAEATGLPAAEATRALIYADQYGQMLRPDRGGWRPQVRRQPY